ncbi:hypothetical protein [Mesorhizobium sp.]|uniref:hypothetical protein n=1 Tax=Mesorhizobium sp. TaxID=1871066 RepID=UPI0025C3C63F|nr:hypothetical protein [Mesorhizobium sp.]
MPAYRSSAEADIRDAAVAKIRQRRPNARIIHEINVSSHGPNRIDVLAVDRAEIIACEVKSAKDKLDRLPAQVASMFGAAHHVIAAGGICRLLRARQCKEADPEIIERTAA